MNESQEFWLTASRGCGIPALPRAAWMLAVLLIYSLGCLCLLPTSPALASEPSIDPDVTAAQRQRIEIMRKAAEATVAVFGPDGGGGGSGVLITSDGMALTNFHVSSACGDFMRCGLNDGKVYDAVIVGIDATGDVSLIQLLGRDDFPTAPLADSSTVRAGQWCFAAGNPFVLATNLQPSISLGIVSGVGRYQYPAGTLLEYADCIQTDAAINPGNSGGPLFNMAGEVIGINGRCSFEKRGRVNVGVGYAISANQLKLFLSMLESGRLVDHATLGATVSTDSSGKVRVSNLLPGSDARRRGLRIGDEIIGLADRDVTTTNGFKNILGTLPKGWRVPLKIRRDGQQQTLLVRLDGVHTAGELVKLVNSGLGGPPSKPPGRPPHERPPEGEDTEKGADDSPPAKAEVSNAASAMFEARPGFANYYFNRTAQQKLWSHSQKQLGDFAESAEAWKFEGELAGENTDVAISLDPDAGSLEIGSRRLTADFSQSMADIVAQRREAGLLVALRALQDLLRIGPELIGATEYLGRLPVYLNNDLQLLSQPRLQTLQSQWQDAVVRFSFSPQSGEVVLVEVFGDAVDDPVELYVDKYQQIGESALRLPSRLRLQYGVEPVMLIQLSQFNLGQAAPAASEGSPQEAVQ